MENFINYTGFALGFIIVFCSAFICSSPVKYIVRLLINSVVGCVILSLVNLWSGSMGFSVGINPFTAVLTGALGIPGAVAVIIISAVIL